MAQLWYRSVMAKIADKLDHLASILEGFERVAVAYSGGADSSFLLAFSAGLPQVKTYAITAVTPFMTYGELAFAESFCKERGIPFQAVDVDPLIFEEVAENPPDRCYHCKFLIMRDVRNAARSKRAIVCDGTNATDDLERRPGTRALRVHDIQSPLAQVGLTKQEIRACARKLQLPRWDAPATTCLATRIPFGTRITQEALERVGQAEAVLHRMGFSQVRVRDHGDVARIEVQPQDISRLAGKSLRQMVDEELSKLGYTYVCADLRGYRRGSMDEGLEANNA